MKALNNVSTGNIVMTSSRRKVKLRKDGMPKLTHSNREEGTSSEVFPFKTKEDIDALITVCNYHLENPLGSTENRRRMNSHKWQRDKMMMIVGMNLGIRASDLRKLKFSFFMDKTKDGYEFKKFYAIKPEKTKNTGKYVKMYFNDAVKSSILEYLQQYPVDNLETYCFRSAVNNSNKPISVCQMWEVINDIAKEANINYNVGTHSLRKTWGYWAWHNASDKNKALVILQECFKHSSTKTTMRYIGIMDEDIEDVFESICLGI